MQVGFAEALWTGEVETSTEERHNVWRSDEQDKHVHGCKRYRSYIIIIIATIIIIMALYS